VPAAGYGIFEKHSFQKSGLDVFLQQASALAVAVKGGKYFG